MSNNSSLRTRSSALFLQVQELFCSAIEKSDGSAKFQSDNWQRPDLKGAHGGGGKTRVLRKGAVFEQAGVNFSEVSGVLPADMTERLIGERREEKFFATGVSLVIHPKSPMIPTTHANLRYLEVGDKCWFGGGTDLTPYYLFPEDAASFHRTIKSVCDRHKGSYYPEFKKWCDEYFYLPHRKETRGVGGIFFDYLGKNDQAALEELYLFVKDIGENLHNFYIPIVEKRKSLEWGEHERNWQLIRRGRYVEFNLLYDRGTLFGLKTSGRTESILMSLPPEVRWEYCYEPAPGSREAELLAVVHAPQEWV